MELETLINILIFYLMKKKDAKHIGSSERTTHKVATAQYSLLTTLHFTQPKN